MDRQSCGNYVKQLSYRRKEKGDLRLLETFVFCVMCMVLLLCSDC